jgi:CheY-like chemotaxis protein
MNQENAHQLGESKHSRIVVLDNEDLVREFLGTCLESLYRGMEIAEFADGDAAWAELSRKTPDLLITDYEHPGLTCEELLTRLAAMKNPCPVVLDSGHSKAQVLDKFPPTIPGLNLNLEFVAKPYSFKQMQAVLVKLLGPPTPASPDHILPLR